MMSAIRLLTRWSLGLLLISAALTGCSKNQSGQESSADLNDSYALSALAERNIKIVDELGAPIVGAQVLIGSSVDAPYTGNLLSTDAMGMIQSPKAWISALPVTINANGYLRATYLGQIPAGQTLVVHKINATPTIELNGDTTGFKVVNNDDKVDFGVVMPAMSRADILYFDLASFVSPETDKISIIGNDVKIPSNVTLPKQNESYILPITLNKPKYRTYFSTPGVKKVVALRGQFPLEDVVDGARDKKKFYEMINLFSIQGGSLKDVTVSASRSTAQLPVNEMNFTQKIKTLAPNFRNDEAIVVAALQEQSGVFFPTDVKMLEPSKVINLSALPNPNPLLIFVKQMKSELEPGKNRLRMSIAINPPSDKVSPEMMDLMKDPVVVNPNHIQLAAPSLSANLKPMATYALLMNVQKRSAMEDGEEVEIESVSRAWEVYGSDWISDLQLPVWPNDPPATGNKRLAVTFLASPVGQKSVDLGPGLMNAVSHATSNSVDF